MRAQLIGRHRLEVREVEAQPLGRDQRALLRTWSPSTWRSAACSRCVAEWFSAVALADGECRRALDGGTNGLSVPAPARVPMCENAAPRLRVSRP
jgi:hypothetical protein